MPKIHTIPSDQTINGSDKLLGSDSAPGALNVTKNYVVDDLKTYILDGVSGGGGVSYVFKTVSVDGQDDIVASSSTDTLTFASGTNITLTTDAVGKTLTVAGPSLKTVNGNSLIGSGNIEISSSVAWGGITGTLSSQTDLQSELDGKQDTITGAATTITGTDLTASRALTSSATGKVEVSAVTSTELGYLDGVTSAVQTQINDRISKSVGTTYNVFSLAAVTQVEYNALTPLPDTIYFII